jgi:hypothetical protein
MSRTSGTFYSDTPHTGGFVFYDALNLNLPSAQQGSGASQLAWTRNAAGDWSLNNATVGVATFNVGMGFADEKRIIEAAFKGMPFQEQFGTAAGTPGYPAPAAGFPPFTGASELTPPLTAPPKGVQITDVVAIYNVGVANLTAASLSLNRTAFTNNGVRVVTNIPVAATALPLVFQAGDYTVVRAVTSTPVFETTDLSTVTLELSVTTAATTTLRVYGLGVHVNFNWD